MGIVNIHFKELDQIAKNAIDHFFVRLRNTCVQFGFDGLKLIIEFVQKDDTIEVGQPDDQPN